jgi:hypothetical protein
MHVFFTTNKNFNHTAEVEPLVFHFSKWNDYFNERKQTNFLGRYPKHHEELESQIRAFKSKI